MPREVTLEVPVFSEESANRVDSLNYSSTGLGPGHIRLELNRPGSYPQGGITPDYRDESSHDYRGLKDRFRSTSLRIMIRPRGPPADGSPDFVYSHREIYSMQLAVINWKWALAANFDGDENKERDDGFVLGVLMQKPQGARHAMVVDIKQCSLLVQCAAPYPCIFHRAFVSPTIF